MSLRVKMAAIEKMLADIAGGHASATVKYGSFLISELIFSNQKIDFEGNIIIYRSQIEWVKIPDDLSSMDGYKRRIQISELLPLLIQKLHEAWDFTKSFSWIDKTQLYKLEKTEEELSQLIEGFAHNFIDRLDAEHELFELYFDEGGYDYRIFLAKGKGEVQIIELLNFID